MPAFRRRHAIIHAAIFQPLSASIAFADAIIFR
jgi:hypothetical protein